MTKIVITQGTEEEISEINYNSLAEIEIQKINSNVLKFSMDYRYLSRSSIYVAICFFLFILLMEIVGLYGGQFTIEGIIIFDSGFILIFLFIWLYYKFKIIGFFNF